MSVNGVLKHCSFGPVWPKDGKKFLLNARKEQLDTSLATASVIKWAFADNSRLESQALDGVFIEGNGSLRALSRPVTP